MLLRYFRAGIIGTLALLDATAPFSSPIYQTNILRAEYSIWIPFRGILNFWFDTFVRDTDVHLIFAFEIKNFISILNWNFSPHRIQVSLDCRQVIVSVTVFATLCNGRLTYILIISYFAIIIRREEKKRNAIPSSTTNNAKISFAFAFCTNLISSQHVGYILFAPIQTVRLHFHRRVAFLTWHHCTWPQFYGGKSE